MRHRNLLGVLSTLFLLATAGASATPTLIGTPTNASSINGLTINAPGYCPLCGTTYDVTFSASSFDSTMSNDTNASDASYSLANALNTLAVTGLNYGGVTGFDCNANLTFCAIWTGASDHTFGAQYTFGTVHAPWSSLFTTDGTLGCPQTTSNDLSLCYEAAHWTKVTVPEPGIVGWFVVGLIGIGLALGRQKKRKLD